MNDPQRFPKDWTIGIQARQVMKCHYKQDRHAPQTIECGYMPAQYDRSPAIRRRGTGIGISSGSHRTFDTSVFAARHVTGGHDPFCGTLRDWRNERWSYWPGRADVGVTVSC